MYKTQRNLIIVTCIFVGLLVISNILAAKVVQIRFIEIPAAVIAYPITFLCIDLVSEIWGKKEAQFVVLVGFIVQVISLGLTYIAIALPAAPYVDQASFSAIIGTQLGIVVASLTAYICSQSFDVFAFHKVKKHFKAKWMRNCTTIVSQLVDTAIFIALASVLVWGVSGITIVVMIASQYLVKVLFAIADTPFFYFFTRHGTAGKPEPTK